MSMMSSTRSAAGVAARPLLLDKSSVSLWSHHASRAHWPPSLLPFSLSLAASPFKNNAGGGLDVPEGVTIVMEADDSDDFVEVGLIRSTHVVKGELKVMSLTDFPELRFERLNALITDEEKEILRRQRIGQANSGKVPRNKGGKHSSETKKLRVIEHMKDPKVDALITDEEKESLRRQRISQANRGKVPWNKGGKHSSETKKRIRARVIERMKDPKIREKLRLQAEAVQLSPEIKMKMRTGIIRAWIVKKKRKVEQELCLLEWEEVIAEIARRGCEGDVEYQWNSYSILRKQAREAIPKKKREPVPKPDRLSVEHRLRISAAIKAKWSEAGYRINVEKGLRKSVSKRVVVPSQVRPKASQVRPKAEPCRTFSRPLKRAATPHSSCISGGDLANLACVSKVTQKSAPKSRTPRPILSSSNHIKNPAIGRHVVRSAKGALRADIMEIDSPKLNTDMPSYKDPEAENKLEKLKSMRARRMHVEAQKQQALTERARALIAQAQEAAKALEAVAVKDKNALAPLLETRKLLAEAVHSLESLNRKSYTSDYIVKEDDSALYAQVMSLANAVSSPLANANYRPELKSSSVESSIMRT